MHTDNPKLILKQVLEPGVSKTYGHQSSIVLADGFWAKAGSDVTATIIVDGLLQMVEFVPPPGYRTSVETYSGSHSDDSVSVDVDKNVDLQNPTNYYASDGIGVREEDDQPCDISLWGRMVDPRYNKGTGRRLAEFALAKCQVRPEKELLKGKFVSLEELKGGFIRSLRVCKGGLGGGVDNYELKGITILPALVSASGDVSPQDVKPQEAPALIQPNCPKDTIVEGPSEPKGWDKWVGCPTGQVITGLQVYHRGKYITALSVRCKSVGWFTAPREPVRDVLGNY